MRVGLVCVEAEDAVELGELLEFLDHWLASDAGLAGALDRFVGGGYVAEELRADLLRFARLLGCCDGPASGGGR